MSFDFEKIYKLYPKRKGSQRKKDAFKKCEKEFSTQEKYDALQKAVINYASECREEKKINTPYVLQFASFVNGVWEEYKESKRAQAGTLLTVQDLDNQGAASA